MQKGCKDSKDAVKTQSHTRVQQEYTKVKNKRNCLRQTIRTS
jgi:hypothetical protein